MKFCFTVHGDPRRCWRLLLPLGSALPLLCAWLGTSTAQAASPSAVVAWGDNTYGQTAVPVTAQSGVTAIAAGLDHTVVLKDDGSVVAWGYNNYGQTTVPVAAQSGVMAIAAGYYHTVVLKTNGSVVAWGNNASGQTTVPVAAQSGVTAIAAGYQHTVVLKNDGSVVAWGYNYNGQTNVPVAAQSGVVAVAAGGNHTVALKNDGSVVAWGYNAYGQTTVPVAAQSGVTIIAAGAYHTVALKNDGSVVAWGAGTSHTAFAPYFGQSLVPVAAQSGGTAITAGGLHTVALKNNGSVVAWGYNSDGQATVPVAAQSAVTAIAAGGSHTVALNDATAPAITTQPVSLTVNAGQSASFTVVATGFYLAYQWRKDGAEIAGALTGTLTLNHLLKSNEGSYSLVVTNTEGSVTSALARLTVIDPAINDQPISQNSGVGESATLSVAAAGTTPLSYQWSKEGVALPEGTQDSLTLLNLQTSDIGNYRVIVSNQYGSVTSAVAALSVNQVTLDSSFNPEGDFYPFASSLAVQADGKILVGGDQMWLNGKLRIPISRLNTDGTPDVQFDPRADDDVNTLVVQADGKILLGGFFTTLGGQSRIGIGRLNADGTVDSGFHPGVAGLGRSLAMQMDGKILALIGGFLEGFLVRLNTDGAVDTGFNAGFNSYSPPLVVQADGKILVLRKDLPTNNEGGPVRLNADGTLDTGFNAGIHAFVRSLAVQADGKILVGGWSFGGLGYWLARLNADGTLDVGFNPAVNGWVDSLVVQTDGKILVGGLFTMLGGVPRTGIARLNADGTIDSEFSPSMGGAEGGYSVGAVSLALQPDGKIVTGGTFTMFGDQRRDHVGRLNNTAPATHSLSHDGSTIVWFRGGTSPEVWRTTFDYSTNGGVAWTSLGTGSRIPGGWRLEGLSLATNGTIRARGYVTVKDSGWFLEDYFGTPVLLAQPISRTNLVGTTATFSVLARGTEPLSYQWRFNGTNILEATNAVITLANVQLTQLGAYSVIVSNSLGWATSRVAQLTVLVPASVLPLPPSTSVLLGSNVTLSANASGTPPLIYQWRKNGANIPAATNSTFTLTNVQVSDGGAYTVVVQNNYGIATSDPTLLIVEVPPQAPGDNFANRVTITNTAGVIGGTNRFATKETGEPNHGGKTGGKSVWYTWQAPSNGIATFRTQGSVFDTLLGIYTGSTVSNLTTIASDEDLGGFFTSEVRFNAVAGTDYQIAVDGFASGQGEFILGWELEITSDTLPVITNQPLSRAVLVDSDVTFNVGAGGTGLTYQWFFNDSVITAATNATLARNNVQAAEVGYYTVRVRNSVGREVESLAAALELVSEPRALSQDKFEDLLAPPVPDHRPPKGGSSFTVSLGSINYQIVNNLHSTTDLGEPTPCDVIGGASQWITLRGTSNGVFRIDTLGSAINTVLTVYRSTNLLYLHTAQVACDDNGAPDGVRSLLWFNATANTDYVVVVDGVNSARGTIHINWAFGLPPSATTNSLPPQRKFLRGQSLTLRSPATNGIPPPRFQWLWNNSPIPGATNALLTLTNLQPAQIGHYTVVVSNALGTLTYATDLGLEVTSFQPELKLTEKVLRLWLPSVTNQTTIVETSTDLQHWTPVYLYAPLQNNFFDLSITNAAQQFFRTRSITSPAY